jgi:hypothetical protein
MTRGTVDPARLLDRARGYLEPVPGDEERVRLQIVEQLSNESGFQRNQPPLEFAAARRRLGMAHLAAVGVVAGVAGFLLGLSVDRGEVVERTEHVPAVEHATPAAAAPSDPSPSLPPRAGPPAPLSAPSPPPPVTPQASAGAATAPPHVAKAARAAAIAPRKSPAATPPSAAPEPTPATDPAATRAAALPSPAMSSAAMSSAAMPPNRAALDLRAALGLLRRAEGQRQAGEPERALATLRELAQRAPALLVEERLVTAVLSECDLGHVERARALARDVARENESSIYARRLRSSCAAMAGGER